MARLCRDFYNRDTVEVARNLLGHILARKWNGVTLAGRIVETEAYVGRCDKACHAYGGRRTARTEAMFLPPGHAYIYLIYGVYHCLNLVTEPENEPAAVLIRSLTPVAGYDVMRRLRYGDRPMTPAREHARRAVADGKRRRSDRRYAVRMRFSGGPERRNRYGVQFMVNADAG